MTKASIITTYPPSVAGKDSKVLMVPPYFIVNFISSRLINAPEMTFFTLPSYRSKELSEMMKI